MLIITSRKKSVRRLIRKFILTFACRVSLVPSKGIRPLLCAWGGISIKEPRTVLIGDDVRFDDIYPELISIGKNTRITAGAAILSHFLDTKFASTEHKPFQFLNGEVVIGDNVFIGANAVICKPLTIGRNAIVAAGAIVTKDGPAYAIVAGVPARIIGTTSKELTKI